jgi:NarL family two-component system response regulator LiaR
MKRHVLIFGVVGGLLIAILQYTEYRFVVIEHSVELYGALVAILFSAFGIWLGLRITRKGEASGQAVRETVRETVVVKEVLVPVAGELFVSENTVKTHCARAFDKLGAARRTQAVQRGKELGLLQ